MSSVSVAITGIGTFWGRELAARLADRSGVARVLGLDLHRPPGLPSGIDFHCLDLTDSGAAEDLAALLASRQIEVLVHLAFRQSPGLQHEYDHALEVGGSRKVLAACDSVRPLRLVIASTTMAYGPRPGNPNYLSESWPLSGHPEAHCVGNRVEVEKLASEWADSHPETSLTLLRSCWAVGPRYSNSVLQFFAGSVVSTCLGYDPLIQFIHEDDLVTVYAEAALSDHPGVFNIVGKGVSPLSRLLALAGKRGLPLPESALEYWGPQSIQRNSADKASGFYDYLRYLWVADGARGWAEFGQPLYTTQEAWISFVTAHRAAGEAQ
jgi:UDP-glucose 4-epimerase